MLPGLERSSETIVLGNGTGSVPAEGTWTFKSCVPTSLLLGYLVEQKVQMQKTRVPSHVSGTSAHRHSGGALIIFFTKAHRRWV